MAERAKEMAVVSMLLTKLEHELVGLQLRHIL